MAQFKPQRRETKGASVGGGGQSLENKLLTFMLLQQRGQQGQQALPEDSVTTGAINPFSGVRTETQAGQDFSVKESLRKKAADDALNLQNSLPILQDMEDSYIEAYSHMLDAGGLSGGFQAAKEYGTGVIGRQNPALRRFVDKISQYEAPLIKIAGDVGNFSGSERKSAREGVPKVSLNTDVGRMFLPDDPEFGLSKIKALKNLYASKYSEAKRVSETGELSPGYSEWIRNQQSTSPIPGSPGYQAAGQQDQGDIKQQYNQLRSSGLSNEEAKRRLGL